MEFPLNDVITRYARNTQLSYQDAERHVFELRRFLVLCATNEGPGYGMRGQIDEAWHTFLMFTREYAEFCDAIGGRFIHHQPHTTPADRSEGSGAYTRFLADYEHAFGEPAPADLWPRPFGSEEVGGPCGGCSQCESCGDSKSGKVEAAADSANCDGCTGCNGRG